MTEGERDYEYLFKIVVIGDSSVGKTCLLLRFVDGIYQPNTYTIGVDFRTKNIQIAGHRIKAQLWDMNGQERFRAITSSVYRGAKGAIICYDISKYSTFDNMKQWVKDFREAQGEDAIILIVGCKCDLENQRDVDQNEAVQYAEENKFLYIGLFEIVTESRLETSALDGTNAEKAFIEIIGQILLQSEEEKTTKKREAEQRALMLGKKERPKRGCC